MSETLKLEFNVHSPGSMAALGREVGILTGKLFAGGRQVRDPETGHGILLAGIAGEPGSGKSVLSAALLYNAHGDAYEDCDGAQITFRDNGERSVVWQSYWSSEQNYQDRVYDALICGYFKSGDFTLDNSVPSLRPRTMPGVEIVEHPYLVPEELITCSISLEKMWDSHRIVKVSFSNLTVQERALCEDLQKLELNI